MSTMKESGQRIALDRIRVPDNVRSLDEAHVQALAGSIALQGVLVPLVVRPDGEAFELVAGFHRLAAARSLELTEVPVVVRDADTEEADRAVENIARKQLSPYLDDGNAWAAERLAREPGWVLDAALANAGDTGGVFAAHLHTAGAHEIAGLRLGKKTEQLYAECKRLHRQLDRYAYGPPPIRFAEEDVDRARAAGVLIEFDSGRPIIVDRSLYRELVKMANQAHPRRPGGQGRGGRRAQEDPADGRAGGGSGRGRQARARRAAARAGRSGARRQRRPQHGAHLPPGRGRSRRPHGGAVLRLRAAPGRSRPLALHQTGERIARLAAQGVRLVIE